MGVNAKHLELLRLVIEAGSLTVAAARLGYSVHMIGAVGEDVFGQALLDNLSKAGVDTSAVARVPGPSGVAPILIDDKGQNTLASTLVTQLKNSNYVAVWPKSRATDPLVLPYKGW